MPTLDILHPVMRILRTYSHGQLDWLPLELALDDAALGFPGQRYYYENPGARLATERRQYLGEVRTARQLGDTTARRQLIKDYLGEKNYFIENYYTKP